MTIEAMKLALDALEFLELEIFVELDKSLNVGPTHGRKAIIALRAAIEEAEKHEPHSLLCVCGAEWDIYPDGKEVLASTAPRQWQALTDEEIKEIIGPWGETPIKGYTRKLFDQIEAKLKEKNG